MSWKLLLFQIKIVTMLCVFSTVSCGTDMFWRNLLLLFFTDWVQNATRSCLKRTVFAEKHPRTDIFVIISPITEHNTTESRPSCLQCDTAQCTGSWSAFWHVFISNGPDKAVTLVNVWPRLNNLKCNLFHINNCQRHIHVCYNQRVLFTKTYSYRKMISEVQKPFLRPSINMILFIWYCKFNNSLSLIEINLWLFWIKSMVTND